MDPVSELKIIARIRSDFPSKFGIPRQSGLVEELKAELVFEPEYRNPEALRGIEGFSHIWLIWLFSEAVRASWSPTVRPPRLGGNTRMGVFATRSPFRPNPIGLSAVRLDGIRRDETLGQVLLVSGADLMDGTPILDIKPYLPFADSYPQASGGFAGQKIDGPLKVEVSQPLLAQVPKEHRQALLGVLAQDPRPSYHTAPQRVYGMEFAGLEVKLSVQNDVLTVLTIKPNEKKGLFGSMRQERV